jgi:hypothetical protein
MRNPSSGKVDMRTDYSVPIRKLVRRCFVPHGLMMIDDPKPLSGHLREAALNDRRILGTGRAVFIEDPRAPRGSGR